MAVGDVEDNAMMEQIEVYSVTKQQDDHHKVINDVDVSDPEAMWQIIKQNAIKSAVVDDLTRILQVLSLCFDRLIIAKCSVILVKCSGKMQDVVTCSEVLTNSK